MDENIKQMLAVGENVAVEFKRCGNGIKAYAEEGEVFEGGGGFLRFFRFGIDFHLNK